MGLLDSVIGALGGARASDQGQGNALRAVVAMLAQGGPGGAGLAGLVQQLQQGGLRELVGSWVGPGRNLPVSPQQLETVLGSERIAQLANELGMSHGDAAGQLSQWLPTVVDRLTPNGQLPEPGAAGNGDLGDIDSLLSHFTRN